MMAGQNMTPHLWWDDHHNLTNSSVPLRLACNVFVKRLEDIREIYFLSHPFQPLIDLCLCLGFLDGSYFSQHFSTSRQRLRTSQTLKIKIVFRVNFLILIFQGSHKRFLKIFLF